MALTLKYLTHALIVIAFSLLCIWYSMLEFLYCQMKTISGYVLPTHDGIGEGLHEIFIKLLLVSPLKLLPRIAPKCSKDLLKYEYLRPMAGMAVLTH